VIVVVASDVHVGRVAPLGPTAIVLDDAEGEPLASALMNALTAQQATRDARVLARRPQRDDDERAARAGAALDHDARILLGIVIGYGANLRDGFAGPLEATARGHVESMLAAAEDLTSLIGRHAATLRAPPPVPGDDADPALAARALGRPPTRVFAQLVDLARPIVGMFGSLAAARHVELRLVDRPAPTIWCDATQIKQVITNLVHNALKFTPPGGAVVVVVRGANAGRDVAPRGHTHAELIVSDTGPGIATEERARVFEPGARLTRDAGVSGRGLGLALVKEVVGRHAGTVRIETSEAGGASLVVTLPQDVRRGRDVARLRADTGDAR
jgi:signal transduction histidine kinase